MVNRVLGPVLAQESTATGRLTRRPCKFFSCLVVTKIYIYLRLTNNVSSSI